MATTLISAPLLGTQMAPDINLDNLKTDLKMNLTPAAPEAPKMKAKKAAKLKKPKPKKHVEKKVVKTLKTKAKIPKAASGKVHKEKHHAHHPPWADMMAAAVGALKERDGSSITAIKKYILTNYQIDTEPDKITPMLRRGLKVALAHNKLRQFKGKGLAGSFKLPVHHGAKTDVGKKLKKNLKKNIKKTNNKKITKKAPKAGGKKILKKDKKLVKKSGVRKVKKITKKEIVPMVGEGAPTLTSLPPLGLGKIKVKKTMKPKSESKKELGMKKKIIRKTPIKGKTGKSVKARKAPKPKLNPVAPVAQFTAQLNPPIITINN